MRSFFDLPIRTKLLLTGALSSGIALLLAGFAIVAYDTYTYGQQKIRVQTSQAETLALSMSAAIAFSDTKAATEYLKAFEANPEILAAAVYAGDGRLFARYQRSGAATIPAAAEAPRERLAGDEVEVFRQVREGDKVVGTVYLRSSAESTFMRALRYGGIIVLVLVGSLVITLPLSARIQRVVAQPIQDMSRALSQLAKGDLTVDLPQGGRSDEIGVLVATFSQMIERMREQLRALVEGANVLGSAASEIVASTSQLTAGASEAAAVVSETAATVEQVRQSARMASTNARDVADIAQKAVQFSQGGRKSTEDVAGGMTRIRSQMEAIASGMMRLSERSQAIGRIMATVEDLAAQSNLLAVNAAIEAAKAGEHGKGFSVVAKEVRSLAEQSRRATEQVRTILEDIQKATSAAVMATEQGGKVVELGSQQTQVAADSIQQLATGVTEAAQAATRIAASSQQQLAGVEQMVAAMESIRLGSVQNVAGARQLEASARNLNELGGRLKEMVALYKV